MTKELYKSLLKGFIYWTYLMNYLMNDGRKTDYLGEVSTYILFTIGGEGMSQWISGGLRMKCKNQTIKNPKDKWTQYRFIRK